MADMPPNPHFALQFRFELLRSGEQRVAVNEDDDLNEIGDSVELILRTVQGERRTNPSFGRPNSLVFMTNRELQVSMIQATIEEHEPRVIPIVRSGEYDPSDPGVARIRAAYEVELPDES